MSSLIPFNRHDHLANKPFTNLIDDFFNSDWHRIQTLMATSFKIDVREELLHYVVEAELPGINKKDIGIDFDNGRLTVAVTRQEDKDEEKSKRYIHKERSYTSCERSVYLEDAKSKGITAVLNDGLLTIRVPKDEDTSQRRKIEIE